MLSDSALPSGDRLVVGQCHEVPGHRAVRHVEVEVFAYWPASSGRVLADVLGQRQVREEHLHGSSASPAGPSGEGFLCYKIVIHSCMSTTVTARIPDELKADMDEYDINVSEVVREALEAEVRRQRRAELIQQGDALSQRIGEQIETERVVEHIRADREAR